MRKLQKLVEPAELVHHLQRRGMNCVAAEIAQKILVLFEHEHVDADTGQEHAEHHPGRPSTGNAASDALVHAGQSSGSS